MPRFAILLTLYRVTWKDKMADELKTMLSHIPVSTWMVAVWSPAILPTVSVREPLAGKPLLSVATRPT